MEPVVAARSHAKLPRGRLARGFQWYSRLELWDQSQLLGKTPDTLTDDEYLQCLHAVHVYFATNAAVRTAWRLEPWSGPQNAAERHNKSRHEYMGSLKRFMWFSSTIFNQELQALAPGSSLIDVSERTFMQALQRTTARASNHNVG